MYRIGCWSTSTDFGRRTTETGRWRTAATKSYTAIIWKRWNRYCPNTKDAWSVSISIRHTTRATKSGFTTTTWTTRKSRSGWVKSSASRARIWAVMTSGFAWCIRVWNCCISCWRRTERFLFRLTITNSPIWNCFAMKFSEWIILSTYFLGSKQKRLPICLIKRRNQLNILYAIKRIEAILSSEVLKKRAKAVMD